jgi:hypothetical protein
MSMRVLLTQGLLMGCLLVVGLDAQSSEPGKCDKQCHRDKVCRQGSCNHPACRIHRHCFRLCNLKPEEISKDAVAAIADVSDRDARKALTLLYGKVKGGNVDPEIKRAMWKVLLLMKAYHGQNEHRRGHMICPAHDGSMIKKQQQPASPQVVSRRHAHRHHNGPRCVDPHHHHNPEQPK